MRHYLSILFVLIFCLATSNSYAQRHIKLEDPLLKNAEQYPVRRKGISTVPKYEFGSYRIVSGKTGWQQTTGRSSLFGSESQYESKQKMSFTLVDSRKDTVMANMLVRSYSQIDQANWFFRNVFRSELSWVSSETDLFEGEFIVSSDTSNWHLMIMDNYAEGMDVNDQLEAFQGYISDGSTMLEIRPVFEDQSGKRSLINPVAGYQFYLEEVAIGAVQIMPVNQMQVWFMPALEPRVRLALASGMAALLVKMM